MKKFLKPLVIATSVAAVAGIGAVSFAAWSGGTNSGGTATGQLGSITAYGFDTALSATMGENKLMPYNQPSVSANQVKVWSVALPTVTGSDATKIQVRLTSDPGLDSSSGIYVKYSTSDVSDAPTALTDYQKLTTSDVDLTSATFAANSQGADGGYLVVALDSSKLADMTKNFSITVTLVAA